MSSICVPLTMLVVLALTPVGAGAQEKPADAATGTPGVITEGSESVSVGGQAAARKGDANDQGSAVAAGSSNVFINGRPAATVGDRTGCGGIVVGGASNVFINGRPVARAGDLTTGCASK
jgi:uncharacterized Zn-binding protein involved in type VI secretion